MWQSSKLAPFVWWFWCVIVYPSSLVSKFTLDTQFIQQKPHRTPIYFTMIQNDFHLTMATVKWRMDSTTSAESWRILLVNIDHVVWSNNCHGSPRKACVVKSRHRNGQYTIYNVIEISKSIKNSNLSCRNICWNLKNELVILIRPTIIPRFYLILYK